MTPFILPIFDEGYKGGLPTNIFESVCTQKYWKTLRFLGLSWLAAQWRHVFLWDIELKQNNLMISDIT